VPVVLLVNGLPGAGKTTLSRALAAELGWLVLSKDAVKEQLFDLLGWSDRAWSTRVGAASMEVIWDVLAAMPGDAIVESAFAPSARRWVVDGLARAGKRQVLEVLCECPPELARRRFTERIERGERHPGHNDPASADLPTPDWAERISAPLQLGLGPLLRVDTTKPVDVAAVASWVRATAATGGQL
jgi:predicted kinase